MVASTLKLGIAILNGGNSTVQQVFQTSVTSVSDMYMLSFITVSHSLFLFTLYSKDYTPSGHFIGYTCKIKYNPIQLPCHSVFFYFYDA